MTLYLELITTSLQDLFGSSFNPSKLFNWSKRFVSNMWFICCATWFIARTLCSYLCTRNTQIFIKELFETLSRKNILYIKVFQSLALNTKFIDENTHEELLKYSDNVYWDPKSIDWELIYSLETKHGIRFEEGYTPINAGMISIVFKVTMQGHQCPLILKMKRKNIEARLSEAIEEFELIAYFASFVPMFKMLQLDDVIRENIQTIKAQTDFQTEIMNINAVRENCANIKYVKIPLVYDEFDEYPDIIVMEYIKGMTISNVLKEDYEEFAKLIIKFTYVNLLIHGLMHADMHSGNILFIKNENNLCGDSDLPKYQIGVIDFGIVCTIEEKFKNILYDIFDSIQRVTGKEFIETSMHMLYDLEPHMEKIGSYHYDKMIEMPVMIIERIFYEKNSNKQINILFEMYSILIHIRTYLKEHEVLDQPLVMNEEFVKIQTILAMIQGVVLKLCGEDCILLMNNTFHELFDTNLLTN